MSGSTKKVGLIICSTTCLELFFSKAAGVAEVKIIELVLFRNSSNFNGRLSSAEGKRKPYSIKVFFRDLSPSYMPRICGTAICDSSIMVKKSGWPFFQGKYDK